MTAWITATPSSKCVRSTSPRTTGSLSATRSSREPLPFSPIEARGVRVLGSPRAKGVRALRVRHDDPDGRPVDDDSRRHSRRQRLSLYGRDGDLAGRRDETHRAAAAERVQQSCGGRSGPAATRRRRDRGGRPGGPAAGGQVSIRLADWWPGYYTFTTMADWFADIQTTVTRVQTMGLTNIYAYELWNEPQGTYKEHQSRSFVQRLPGCRPSPRSGCSPRTPRSSTRRSPRTTARS